MILFPSFLRQFFKNSKMLQLSTLTIYKMKSKIPTRKHVYVWYFCQYLIAGLGIQFQCSQISSSFLVSLHQVIPDKLRLPTYRSMEKNHLFFKRRQSMQITEMALSSREKYFIVSSEKFHTFFLFQLSFKWLEVRRIHSTNSCIFKIENAWNILDSKWVKYKVLFKYWFKISFPLLKLHICNETNLVIVWNLYINKLWSVQEKKNLEK